MDIYPVYILNVVLILVILRIKSFMNNENKYHLKFLVFHFVFQLISTLNISIFTLFGLKAPIVIICIGRVFAFIFFYLFLKSIYDSKEARLTLPYIIPVLLLVLFDFLNNKGFKFYNFISDSVLSENILGFFTSDFKGKSDLFLMLCCNTTFFTILIFFKYFQLIKSDHLKEKQKKVLINFINYYYLLITITSISTLIALGLYLINIPLYYFITLVKLLAIITLFILVLRPQFLKRLSNIKLLENPNPNLKNIFFKVLDLFDNNKVYLDPNYFAVNIAVDTGLRNELIRKSIREFSDMTVPQFINSYRVKYSCKLIKNGYLKNYSMDALAEKSGFSSQKNFNRVFKLIKSCTPSEYKNLCE